MLKERIGPLLGIVAVFYGLQIILFVMLGIILGASMVSVLTAANLQSGGMGALGAGSVAAIVVFYLVLFWVGMAQYCSLSSMSSPLRKPAFGEALKTGFNSSLTCLGILILMLVPYIAFVIVFAIVGGILVAVAGIVGGVITGILAVGALLFFASRLSIILPVIAVDGIRNPVRAIARSWSLTSGHAFKIFLLSMVFFVVVFILFGLSFAPVFGAIQSSAITGSAPNLGGLGFAFLALTVVGVLVVILTSVFQATIHAELVGHVSPDLAATFE